MKIHNNLGERLALQENERKANEARIKLIESKDPGEGIKTNPQPSVDLPSANQEEKAVKKTGTRKKKREA